MTTPSSPFLRSDLVLRLAQTPTAAIILAAGRGARLGLERPTPKCLVHVGKRTLLANQLRSFARAGVTHVVIVVGYEADQIEAHAAELAAALHITIECRHNPRWADSNTLYSMAVAADVLRDHATRGCFTANADVLFDDRLLFQLVKAGGESGIAVESSRCAEEEVKVRVDAAGRIHAISKQIEAAKALGEAVGISRFRGQVARDFADALDEMATRPEHAHDYFERALEQIAPVTPLHAVVLEDAPVIEIDFRADLERARDEILPTLQIDTTP